MVKIKVKKIENEIFEVQQIKIIKSLSSINDFQIYDDVGNDVMEYDVNYYMNELDNYINLFSIFNVLCIDKF